MNLFDHSAEIAQMQIHLTMLAKGFLGLAYHEYQKQKHLLGDMSFPDWVETLPNKYQESEYFPKD